MPTFELTYGRALVLKASIVAENIGAARHLAMKLETEGLLSVGPVAISNPRVELYGVDDYAELWNVDPSPKEDESASNAFTAADLAAAPIADLWPPVYFPEEANDE